MHTENIQKKQFQAGKFDHQPRDKKLIRLKNLIRLINTKLSEMHSYIKLPSTVIND